MVYGAGRRARPPVGEGRGVGQVFEMHSNDALANHPPLSLSSSVTATNTGKNVPME